MVYVRTNEMPVTEFADELVSVADCDSLLVAPSLQLHSLEGAKVGVAGSEVNCQEIQSLVTITAGYLHQASANKK